MMPALHMTRTQERRFYRNAVQASLETFYGKSGPEAAKLVRDWWSRLRSTKAFESGIFLHAEPMNTAANIADLSVIAITKDNRAAYHRLLDESRDRCILPVESEGVMASSALYIERRDQGDYAVRKPGSERASAILPTQAAAIEKARKLNPDAAVHVERVRDTNVGGRDKWRKA